MLERLVVRLLAPDGDLAMGAERARRSGLARLFLDGVTGGTEAETQAETETEAETEAETGDRRRATGDGRRGPSEAEWRAWLRRATTRATGGGRRGPSEAERRGLRRAAARATGDGRRATSEAEWRGGLRRAAAREALDEAREGRELAKVLARLGSAGIEPVVLKGRALARAWGAPGRRPVGDLDLLVPEAALDEAARLLAADGYRRAPEEPGGRFRAPPTGIELLPPRDSTRVGLPVDLHARLFRSIGARLDARAALARAQPADLDGVSARVLSPADELVYVYVHAAKHAVRAPKWLLDLAALALARDEATFAAAWALAGAAGVRRPFAAAARLAARLPGVPVPPFVCADRLAPALDRLFTVEAALASRPLGLPARYALEVLLEPDLLARTRRLAGLTERLVRRARLAL